MKNIIRSIYFIFIVVSINAQDTVKLSPNFEFRSIAELGFLGVLEHKVQFSENGTYFDYVNDGGQDVVFPISRFSLELEWNKRNTLYFLYQPLRLETQVLLTNDLLVDNQLFPSGTNVKLLYNFPFYRVSYTRELVKHPTKFSFALGGSIQLRNATINFESADGSMFRANRDIGVVPAIKIKTRYNMSPFVFTEIEADGMYAPISYLNGSDNEVVGAILDASLRTGIKVNKNLTPFFNLRYLGGGAVGTSENEPGPGDGYVKNWLNFLTVSAGACYTW